MIFLASILLTIADGGPEAQYRRWPDGNGGIVRGSLVLERTDDVVILISTSPRLYRAIPKHTLRNLDLRYLARLKGRPELFTFDLQNVPELQKKIALIEDGASLLEACSALGSMDKEQVFETLRNYLSLCERDDRFDPDNVWFLTSLIFECPAPPYPDFWDSSFALTEPTWPKSSCSNFKTLAGLPFFGPTESGHSGPCWPNADFLLTWLESHGELKSPLIQAESLPTTAVSNQPGDNSPLRRQAWRMVSHLFEMEWDLVYSQPIDNERWARLSEMLTKLEVEWDSKSLQFEAASNVLMAKPPVEWLPTELIHRQVH